MTRTRRKSLAALLAVAGLVVVSLGVALHHHEGATGLDCVACHAAAAPALVAPAGAFLAAPDPESTVVAVEPATPAGRLAETFSPARAPPADFSLEA